MAMAEAVEPAASDRRTLACGINMAMRFSTLAIRPSEEDNDTSMTSAIVREGT
jgi:hypothetical protein